MISWGYVTPRVMEWGEPARTLCFLYSEFFGASLLVKTRGLEPLHYPWFTNVIVGTPLLVDRVYA